VNGFFARAFVVVAVVLCCAIGLTAALALLVAADYFAFALILSPPLAALAAAGTALLFCLLAAVLGKVVLSGMRAKARRNFQERVALILGEVFGVELLNSLERNPSRLIGIALLAGAALGFSPALRKALFAFFRR
jgi:hypothetical protein